MLFNIGSFARLLPLVCVLLFLGCQNDTDSPADIGELKPDIILISIDTLRADHLGCYGYKDAKTPNIDQLAAEGVLFENAFTTVPVTLPAHSSMLTGLIPPNHGVRDNGGDELGDSVETIAEVLKTGGYQTAAFIGAEPLVKGRGLHQGFNVYDDQIGPRSKFGGQPAQRSERFAEDVAASAAAWVHSCDTDKPLFAFIHFFDPHWPYEKALPGQAKPSYDGEIAHVDRVIGKLLKSISNDRRENSRIIVLTADHGEALGEHGEKTHCIFVYDSTLHIPLILRSQGLFESRRISDPVGIIDVAPTLVEFAELDGLGDSDGISLVQAMIDGNVGSRDLYFESLYGDLRFGWAPLRGIRRGSIKFIDAPKPELYDLEKDPKELTNLFAKTNSTTQEFKNKLAVIGDGTRTTGELNEEAIRKLAELGYVSARPVEANGKRDRPDPKDRVDVYDRFHSVYKLFASGEKEEALEIMAGLEKVMSLSPQFFFEWGVFQTKAEKWNAAAASYLRCLELSPTFGDARLNLAAAQMKELNYADAQKNLDLLLVRNPDHGIASLYAGFCAKELGDTELAINHWKRFVKLAPNHPDAEKIRTALGIAN